MHAFDQNGFCLLPSKLADGLIDQARIESDALLRQHSGAGLRQATQHWPLAGQIAESPQIRALIEPILGKQARLVKALLFNKDPQSNWKVSWHQDLSIAVKQRHDLDGYQNWNLKDGLQHVQPPVEILQSMLTVRLHLDPADKSNGALWVCPASHRSGRIPTAKVNAYMEKRPTELCKAKTGDVLLMRPLLLHASRMATRPSSRRILHLEYSAADLPTPLAWADA